ncbi:MAG: hypothetical protein AVDCRST_MAG35-2470 [uncultured Quadrisphaera sp.]|uniref:Uncharacterized protein n=1 Tax=uncultured Quadrisphaera sp. TaxID=904978 RepID=A0A6J4PY82_9ACTN|nr:MAG: hypothetical protein AVDCRST_MAG35-2470 [uncultured Quadrisphaera sp.]
MEAALGRRMRRPPHRPGSFVVQTHHPRRTRDARGDLITGLRR